MDNDGQIKFLKDGRIIWISEQSKYKHLWMSKHSGSKIWPITQGEWEVSKIVHIDEDKEIIYFMANRESVFENRLYSVRYDGTEINLLTRERGNHTVSILGSKLYFLDTYSSLQKPKIIKIKELISGSLIRVIDTTNLQQFIDYNWSIHRLSTPFLDSTVKLDGHLLPPKDYDPNKVPCYYLWLWYAGNPNVWNKWGLYGHNI